MDTENVEKKSSKNSKIKALKPVRQAPKPYLEFEEALALAKAATNLRDQLLILLLLRVGCRVSEALALTVNDINFDIGTISIKHLKASVRLSCPKCSARLSKVAIYCPVCGKRVLEAIANKKEIQRLRTIPIDQDTLDLLREYVERGGAIEKNGKKLIFGINRHRAWQIIKDAAIKSGLPLLTNLESGKVHYVSPHRLRDCFAIRAVKKNDSGDSLRMLQQHLGHQNINTTMSYRKVAGQELRIWYQHLWVNDK